MARLCIYYKNFFSGANKFARGIQRVFTNNCKNLQAFINNNSLSALAISQTFFLTCTKNSNFTIFISCAYVLIWNFALSCTNTSFKYFINIYLMVQMQLPA